MAPALPKTRVCRFLGFKGWEVNTYKYQMLFEIEGHDVRLFFRGLRLSVALPLLLFRQSRH